MEDLDYLKLLKEAKKIDENSLGYRTVKIAILGDNTTQQLTQILKAFLYRKGIFADIYEADFDIIDQEIYDNNSGFNKFFPDYVCLHTSVQKLRDRYYQLPDTDRGHFVDEHTSMICSWWEAINARASCRIIQNTYALPIERLFGNYTLKRQDNFYMAVKDINQAIIRASKDLPEVFFNDIEYLSSDIGKKHWYDEKLWVYAKLFCSLEHMPSVVENIAVIILAGAGRSQKCLVLDLDNTLWGGMIGEDGIEKIEIGREGGGEAFYTFQQYLLGLKNRGILLAVCSKNDHENAIQPFEKHSDMVLKEEDIVIFVANWESKAENIKYIAEKLNIGLDTITFLDDSSFERNHVRTMLPEVTVPEMPEDPVNFVSFINGLHLFETLGHSQEDEKRTGYYRQQVKRDGAKTKYSGITDYLKSLEMKAAFQRFDAMNLSRIVQLIQRSNQFNLTTKRHNEKECEAFLSNERDYYPVYVTLKDKYGDNGLISVIILKIEGTKLFIDTWLMSCRVLCRGVEQFAMNQVVNYARERNCSHIEGVYSPTPKNHMVKDFYEQFGFKKVGSDEDSKAVWDMAVEDYTPHQAWVERIEEEECQVQPL